MHVGVVLRQSRTDWAGVLDSARHAEEAGADSVWVVDHLLSMPAQNGILEAWTLLSALAASTQRVELGAQVFCQSFRNPALFAKMAATLDRVSGGRLRMLIGAGWFEDEYKAFGYEFPAAGVLVEQLRDTLRILKGLLSGSEEPFTYEGTHYSVSNALNVPPPPRPIPIEIGGGRDRVLRTIAREADGWNSPAIALGMVDDRLALLRAACERNGRSIDELRLTCQITCTVGDDEAEQRPEVAMFMPQNGLRGSVEEAIERVNDLASKGIEGCHVIVPSGDRGRACLERLLNEVRPKVG
jgi:alkanesulfonate monooxygenase SsuD/methylene tetrahydromethanopterin reductase-like flavin-dependent oxidoreductase (luciferase family)